jgi:hypothetical protein
VRTVMGDQHDRCSFVGIILWHVQRQPRKMLPCSHYTSSEKLLSVKERSTLPGHKDTPLARERDQHRPIMATGASFF